MKKHKNIKHHIIKRGWIIFGIILFIWTAFWFVKVSILNQSAFAINTTLLIIGYCLLIDYALITVIYWTVKRLKKKWEIRA